MIKKADVYVQEFMDVFEEKKECKVAEDALRDTVIEICQRLIEEVKEIMLMRKAISDTAFEAVIKEQDRKWKAIIRRLDPNKFPLNINPKAFQLVWAFFKVEMMKNG